MAMKLRADYRKILAKAWSVRLILLAGLLSTAEAVLPLFANELPRSLFSVATAVAVTGALVARITVQKEFDHGD